MPLTIPAQQKVSRETLMSLFPKNWASHLLGVGGGMLGSYNRKKKSKIVVAKRQRKGKAHENGTKENPQMERELPVKQTCPLLG